MRSSLIISKRVYPIIFISKSLSARKFYENIPIVSSCNNLGGEIYFRIPGIDIPYDGTETVEFKPGDVTYWRSPNAENIYSICIFFGNTPFGNGESIRAASPCIKIGEIEKGYEKLNLVKTGERVIILK